jgi:hypothetical protein
LMRRDRRRVFATVRVAMIRKLKGLLMSCQQMHIGAKRKPGQPSP